MRRGYTLIEIIITIAITGILAIGMFKALEAITIRSEKAKILTALSIDSQSALDQLSLLLYDRAPMSAQGCSTPNDCVVLDIAIDAKILQWYGTASESYQAGDYSGLVDITNSQTDKSTQTIFTPNTNYTAIQTTQNNKWGITDLGLVFAGAFENGERLNPYKVTITENNKIVFGGDIPNIIYEKYYLVDSAYAVTRNADITTLSCTNVPTNIDKDTLLLFYDYRPWKGQNFCEHGKVTVLSENVNAFAAHQINGTIRLGIDMNKTAGHMKTNPIRLSKQKVVF